MIKVVDNFYSNVDSIREYASSLDFSVKGNFPGGRTEPYGEKDRKILKNIVQKCIDKKIVFWPGVYNTAFQYTKGIDETWIHHDSVTNYAGVVYLTPNPPIDTGTSFFMHKQTGYRKHKSSNLVDFNKIDSHNGDWVEVDRIGNVYNRAIFYDANLYHCSTAGGFGKTLDNGRLTQTFFFDAE